MDHSISNMAQDGKRFIGYFGDGIVQSAPQIYLSALAFSPCWSWIFKQFQEKFSNTLTVEIGQLTEWPATFAVLEGHTSYVTSVAYSPDGKHIVSGSLDKTVRVWDSNTGHQYHPYETFPLVCSNISFHILSH